MRTFSFLSLFRPIVGVLFFTVSLIGGQALCAEPKYSEPLVGKALFDTKDVELMAIDRDKLASSVVSFIVNTTKDEGEAAAMETARRLIGFALHLSPRNREAVVANFQFKRGLPRKKIEPEYSPVTLAEVLQSRATSLVTIGGELNILLAGYMLSAAVEIDSTNETAIYELEMYRKDIGEIDWTTLLGGQSAKSTKADR